MSRGRKPKWNSTRTISLYLPVKTIDKIDEIVENSQARNRTEVVYNNFVKNEDRAKLRVNYVDEQAEQLIEDLKDSRSNKTKKQVVEYFNDVPLDTAKEYDVVEDCLELDSVRELQNLLNINL